MKTAKEWVVYWKENPIPIEELITMAQTDAAQQAVIPDGFVVVPKEPTTDMIDHGWGLSMEVTKDGLRTSYPAMIEARPPVTLKTEAQVIAPYVEALEGCSKDLSFYRSKMGLNDESSFWITKIKTLLAKERG